MNQTQDCQQTQEESASGPFQIGILFSSMYSDSWGVLKDRTRKPILFASEEEAEARVSALNETTVKTTYFVEPCIK